MIESAYDLQSAPLLILAGDRMFRAEESLPGTATQLTNNLHSCRQLSKMRR